MTTVTEPAAARLSPASQPYTVFNVAYIALDPIHVGAGGHRLGRVDMTIVREPGTRLPKVPGTSLSGAARSYAALLYNKPEAAGQHKKLKDRTGCPILHTFGSATDDDGQGNAGTVSICDARILLFPVATSLGPAWVTTPSLLREAGFQAHTFHSAQPETVATNLTFSGNASPSELNLGWLLFQKPAAGAPGKPSSGTVAAALASSPFQPILDRIVAVHEQVLSAIVNSNLEVRTSVSINPATGVAEDTALFTYEALPRLTILIGEVVEDDHRVPAFQPVTNQFRRPETEDGTGLENKGRPLSFPWTRPAAVVQAGMDLMQHLGVGGMGTRGFGRLKALWATPAASSRESSKTAENQPAAVVPPKETVC